LLSAGVAIQVWIRCKDVGNSKTAYLITGGLFLDALGFVVGFFGPMLIDRNATAGPLPGICITGPVGFIVGLVAGGLLWKKRLKQVDLAN